MVMSGLKSNLKDLYEDVNEYHSYKVISPQSARHHQQIIYDPHNILRSAATYSEHSQLGPISIKKALEQDLSCSPQAGNFTQREFGSDSPNGILGFNGEQP